MNLSLRVATASAKSQTPNSSKHSAAITSNVNPFTCKITVRTERRALKVANNRDYGISREALIVCEKLLSSRL